VVVYLQVLQPVRTLDKLIRVLGVGLSIIVCVWIYSQGIHSQVWCRWRCGLGSSS
jgi:hypothetical protein